MCDLYSLTTDQKTIQNVAKATVDHVGNMPILPAIFPNRMAPVVRTMPDGQRELLMMRWGFPAPIIPDQEPRNQYLTNIRKVDSCYWQTYLQKPEHRCLVPATSFAEADSRGSACVWTWFARDETRPLMFFAGVWREWDGDRGTKTFPDIGKHLVFSFLTTDASPAVKPIHPEVTPVLLMDEFACDEWLLAPWEVARNLQKPPPPGTLRVVASGKKEDL